MITDGAPPELYRAPRWYVLATRSRAEKRVERSLLARKREVYLPLVPRDRRWVDRIRKVQFPLFPGYVFARFSLTELDEVLRTPGVTRVLTPNGYPTPVREAELKYVRRLVKGASASGVEPATEDRFVPGAQVVVTSGIFRGMRGTLLEDQGRTRVAVYVSALGQARSVQIPRRAVAPADREPEPAA